MEKTPENLCKAENETSLAETPELTTYPKIAWDNTLGEELRSLPRLFPEDSNKKKEGLSFGMMISNLTPINPSESNCTPPSNSTRSPMTVFPKRTGCKFIVLSTHNDFVELHLLERSKENVRCYWIQYIVTWISSQTSRISGLIIQHPLFELVIVTLIVFNCIIIAMEDPQSDSESQWYSIMESIFQGIYTLEAILKIFAMGFIWGNGAYIRDPWNILDFIIVIFGYMGYFNFEGALNLKVLRSFRVLRSLRTISFFEGLKLLIVAVFSSFPLLIDTIIILLFFFFLFAVAGLQLWHGKLLNRCIDLETGEIEEDRLCGDRSCAQGSKCFKYINNLNKGTTSFDSVFTGLLTIFQSVTLQGWSDNQQALVDVSGIYAISFFLLLAMVGSFFILNFTLAVITTRVTQLFKEGIDITQRPTEDKKIDIVEPKIEELPPRPNEGFTSYLPSELSEIDLEEQVFFNKIMIEKPKKKSFFGRSTQERKSLEFIEPYLQQEMPSFDNIDKDIYYRHKVTKARINLSPIAHDSNQANTNSIYKNVLRKGIRGSKRKTPRQMQRRKTLRKSTIVIGAGAGRKREGTWRERSMKNLFASLDSPSDNPEEQNFFLQEDPIFLQSAKEVLPSKFEPIKENLNDNLEVRKPPYKIGIKFEPTHFSISDLKLLMAQTKLTINEKEQTMGFITLKEKKRRERISEIQNRMRRQKTIKELERTRQFGAIISDLNSMEEEQSSDESVDLSYDDFYQEAEEKEENQITGPPRIEQRVQEIRIEDKALSKQLVEWSGQEVIPDFDPEVAKNVTSLLNKHLFFRTGILGEFSKFRYIIKKLVTSLLFEYSMLAVVLLNTVFLGMNRYGQPIEEQDLLSNINIGFNAIYIVELVLKLFGLGVVRYLMDPLNYLDTLVVLLSLVELFFVDSNFFSAFAAFKALRLIRVVRMLRVLRVARLFKLLSSMQLILGVMSKTIGVFAYIIILLLVFLFIYALIGMQLFAGRFVFNDTVPRQNFDDFHQSFISAFQILTLEKWQLVFFNAYQVQSAAVVIPYFISWIFLGNYVLLNLFLAVILKAFSETDEELIREEEATKNFIKESERKARMNKKRTGIAMIRKATVFRPQSRNKKKGSEVSLETYLAKKNKKSKEPPKKSCHCEYSFYLFSKENPLRILIWNIVTSDSFEYIVLTLIALSSIHLTIDTYFQNETETTESQVMQIFNIIFTISFAVEALMKAISYGLIFDEDSYLRDAWNFFDFTIILLSLVDLSVSEIDLKIVKIFRVLRALRPLRFVTHNSNMRVIVQALLTSFRYLFNALIVVIIIYAIFSIVGVSLFAGKYQYCSELPYEYSTREVCENAGGKWSVYDQNFDNIVNGLTHLFILTSKSNWPNSLLQASDCTEVDKGPSINASWYLSYYYVIFIAVSSILTVNLFLGILFLRFSKERQIEGSQQELVSLSEEQNNWILVQKMIIRAQPNFNSRTLPKKEGIRRTVHNFITWLPFDIFMTVMIICNLIHMGMLYEGASPKYLYALDVLNYLFTAVFTFELSLKMVAYGMDFWYDPWNIFSLLIILSSYIDIVFMNVYDQGILFLRIIPALLRVLRVLRISKLLRIMRKYKRMQELVEIVILCLPSMLNVFSLMLLILFIYAVLGSYLFGDVTKGSGINDLYNFSNFGYGLIMCLKIATGEDWNLFMYDILKARNLSGDVTQLTLDSAIIFAYFLTFKVAITFIMINFYVLAVLGLFDTYFVEADSIVSKFKEDLEIFMEHWHQSAPIFSGFFIHDYKLVRFFVGLPPPLGLPASDMGRVSMALADMGINSDSHHLVHFNELLYCFIKRARAEGLPSSKAMVKFEAKVRLKILAASQRFGTQELHRSVLLSQRASPFRSLMLMRMTLKMWLRFSNSWQLQQSLSPKGRSPHNHSDAKNSSLKIYPQPEDTLRQLFP